VKKRVEFLQKLSPYASEFHGFLTENREELVVRPDKQYDGDEEEIAKTLLRRLSGNYDKDLRLGFTTVGPHRDDLSVLIGGADAKSYASQGQMRTAALALKLAEVQIFKELSGEYPILILDDVMSELDLTRRKKLLQKINGVQTLLTCTHAERVLYGATCNKIRIENGKIKN
jgi:DNA replication and repair protein RecF